MTKTEFISFIVSRKRKLYYHAYRILRDRESSEDAVQEVFIRLWKMKTKIKEYESIDALSVMILKNYCIDQLRKKKYVESDDRNSISSLYDTEPSPQDKLESNEKSAIIMKIIDELPESYREIIMLRDIEELSYEEISDKTKQTINTLRVILSRARKIVRDEFKKQSDEFN
jgi:RNA polymerase sigma-70 factor (ECF subfamily)